jgi:alpha-L-arabinofuranosidase
MGEPGDEEQLTGFLKAALRKTGKEAEPLNARNTHYAAVTLDGARRGGLRNLGYHTGIPVREREEYCFSCYARNGGGGARELRLSLESDSGEVYAAAALVITGGNWQKYTASLCPARTDFSGRLVITSEGAGCFYLDMVSLFPEKTFMGRENGLRADLAALLKDMKPRFVRFPGGCLVHDGSLDPDARDSLYRWKDSIGPVESRPARRNNWNYNQTLGLGYYEYFLFCEDIGAAPLPVLPGACNPHNKTAAPLDSLAPWIDDALDLIEFANGDLDTVWGAKRAELGHPAPFGLEYIAIGNEETQEEFFERYPYFHQAIKARYPGIKIINSAGQYAADGGFTLGWESARENGSDIVDEHYYNAPEWFIVKCRRYDAFPRGANDPKVFVGEYASWGSTWYNALCEAAFMTGLERNAGLVALACYAPLLCNAAYVNWKPNLLYYNNHEAFGSANYYVQKLFMQNQGVCSALRCSIKKIALLRNFLPCKLPADFVRGSLEKREITRIFHRIIQSATGCRGPAPLPLTRCAKRRRLRVRRR